ncbi:MAG: endonuclease [Flavobacteriales bacterium]|jgi:endonuclease/exonuclease/phosphatase family metal-dependent hydrolase|nr:endonuclease [Flavobacteriales bacterium]
MKKTLWIAGLFTIFLSCQNNETNNRSKSDNNSATTKTEQKKAETKAPKKNSNSTLKLKKFDQKILAFYNVENLFDTHNNPKTLDDDFLPKGKLSWTKERYHKKLNNLARVIDDIPGELPIFLGMVEVENRKVLEDLTQKTTLKKGNYGISHFQSLDKRGIDNALVYRKDFAKLLEEEAITPEIPRTLTRDILYSKFQLIDGKILHTFVNHWPSRREGEQASSYKREAAAKTLKKLVDRILTKDRNANIVIMGDFNDYPTNKSIQKVLQATKSTKGLYNFALEWQENAPKTKQGSHSYRGKWGMLDQIIVSPNMMNPKGEFALKQKDFNVFRKDYMVFKHPKYGTYSPSRTYAGPKYIGDYSDHLPIYLSL